MRQLYEFYNLDANTQAFTGKKIKEIWKRREERRRVQHSMQYIPIIYSYISHPYAHSLFASLSLSLPFPFSFSLTPSLPTFPALSLSLPSSLSHTHLHAPSFSLYHYFSPSRSRYGSYERWWLSRPTSISGSGGYTVICILFGNVSTFCVSVWVW